MTLRTAAPPVGDAQFFPTRWERFLQILETFSETRPSWLAAQVKDDSPFRVKYKHSSRIHFRRKSFQMTDSVKSDLKVGQIFREDINYAVGTYALRMDGYRYMETISPFTEPSKL